MGKGKGKGQRRVGPKGKGGGSKGEVWIVVRQSAPRDHGCMRAGSKCVASRLKKGGGANRASISY